MSDDKTVTEREAVLRERAAFAHGAYWAWLNNYAESSGAKFNHEGYVDLRAAERYPLPTITRPRVVRDPRSKGYEWQCVGGALQWRYPDTMESWSSWDSGGAYIWTPVPDRVKLWADLLQNPLEEVQE